jgi:Cu(I)/Ag(I) efflux system protein CusF
MFTKQQTAVTLLVLAAGLPAFAQQKAMDGMKGMAGMGSASPASAAAAATHHAAGIVKNVDRKTGLVMLAHEPVKTLNWPAMTMGFRVEDPLLFDKLVPSKKVDFDFVQTGKGYVVTGVR